jgi:hypothetical protein
VVAALALTLSAACSRPPDDYGAQTEEVFLRKCVGDDGEIQEELCRCAYDRIRSEIPYDEYVALDKALADKPDALPEQIVALIFECAADLTTSTTSAETTATTSPP